jgi:hypothetical protein
MRAELRYTLSDTQNRSLFGYQGVFNELRFKHDMVCGKMRQSEDGYFSKWTMSRHFPSSLGLGWDFLIKDMNMSADGVLGAKRVFAAPSQPAFVVNFKNHIRAVRPLPYRADPGLIDHF